jgi:hypothetical protein
MFFLLFSATLLFLKGLDVRFSRMYSGANAEHIIIVAF